MLTQHIKLLIGLTFPLMLLTAQAADVAAGKAKYAACAGCHGQNGHSASPAFPTLAGKDATYLSEQLQAFKSGKRNNPMMSPQAKALSDVDIANITAFLANNAAPAKTPPTTTSKPAQTNQTVAAIDKKPSTQTTKADANAGKTKYATCAGCHGANGKSMSPTFPTLAGKSAAYITAALHDFKSGKRNNPMMSPQAKALSDHDIDNIAAFLGAQK